MGRGQHGPASTSGFRCRRPQRPGARTGRRSHFWRSSTSSNPLAYCCSRCRSTRRGWAPGTASILVPPCEGARAPPRGRPCMPPFCRSSRPCSSLCTWAPLSRCSSSSESPPRRWRWRKARPCPRSSTAWSQSNSSVEAPPCRRTPCSREAPQPNKSYC